MENMGSGTGIAAAAMKGAPEVVKNNGVPPGYLGNSIHK